jgi:hypothetical protein
MCGDIRAISGYDKNRENRFYFTKNKTPVRVYFNYDGNLTNASNLLSQMGLNIANNKRTTNDRITSSLLRKPVQILPNKKFSNIGEDEDEEDDNKNNKIVKKKSDRILQIINGPVNLNGRKLSANSLRNTKISSHFMDEAKNFLYSNETMSFFPPVEVKEFTRNTLTLAEMAVLPLHREEEKNTNNFHHQQQNHISHSKVSVAQHAQVKQSVARHQPKQSTLGLNELTRSMTRPDALNEISEDD